MIFSRVELIKLAGITGRFVVSIYIPTHRSGDIEQDRIRLKNMLADAEARLISAGVRPAEARRMLEPGKGLVEDNIDFWQHQSDGLAVFLAPGTFLYYRLPFEFRETLTVSERCYVKPLLPLLHGDGMFYVLALSQNAVRLLQCSRDSHRLVTPEGVPESIAEALKYDQPEAQHQFHTVGPGPAIFHGQGISKDEDKVNILRYFQQVDRGLHAVLREEKAPLVLVAVDYLHALYREVNTYRYLLEEGVAGNPDEMSDARLRHEAWSAVEPIFTRDRDQALSDYALAASKGLGTSDIKQIVTAAHDGRVSILIVASGAQQWGSFDTASRKVRLYEEARPGTEDLLETASVDTLLKDGGVFAMPSADIPDGAPAAAILRY